MKKLTPNMGSAENAARRYLSHNREILCPIGADHRLSVMRDAFETSNSALSERVIKLATSGDRSARRACLEAAAKYIAKGHSLQEPLAGFIAQLLLSAAKAPIGRRGQDPRANRLRDMAIATAVLAASEDGGIHPTRNAASRDQASGCSVVAQILTEFGVKLSEGGVEKIWKRYKD